MNFSSNSDRRKQKTIKLVPYNPEWPALFEKEAQAIAAALGDKCLAIHHFGSTAVPGLRAKPVIDCIAVVHTLASIPISALEQLGFEHRGEVILSGRYFSKMSPRVHLHVFETGNPLIQQNLDFRDWLREHEEDRDAYAQLKEQLATCYTDGMLYAQAKTEFVNSIVQKISLRKERHTYQSLIGSSECFEN